VVPDSSSASDFSLFDETVGDSWSSGFGGADDDWGWFSATQTSEVQTSHFSIHGIADGGSGSERGSYIESSAHSDFEVLFEVTTPTPFSLVGSLATAGGGAFNNIAGLHLDWNGAPYLDFSAGNNEELDVNEGGVLEPGAYVLAVSAWNLSYGDNAGASSQFDIEFEMGATVPVEEVGVSRIKAMFH
jgi:hypothetical protein